MLINLFRFGLLSLSVNALAIKSDDRMVKIGAAAANETAQACTNMYQSGIHTIQITSSGSKRTFDVFIPSILSDNDPRPTIFMWHGFSGSPSKVMEFTNINKEAEQKRWFAVYPKGTGLISGFNGAGCCPGVFANDVQFAKDIITWLKTELCVDADNVFSTGFSNGGFMSNRLACEVPELFKAIAPHSGTIGKSYNCNPSKGVPVLLFHGDADPTVPYFGNSQWMSFQEAAAKWAQLNQCGDENNARDSYQSQTTTCVRFDSCGRDNVPLEYCSITGLAHSWSGVADYDIDATAHLFEFFMALASA
jgi:polyhydroxybutyrate depolymerase